MVGPFLVVKLRESHFSTGVLEKMRRSMNLSRCSQVLNEILLCWTTMATANATCFASTVRDYDSIDRKLHDLASRLTRERISFCRLVLKIYFDIFNNVNFMYMSCRYFQMSLRQSQAYTDFCTWARMLDDLALYEIFPSRLRRWCTDCTRARCQQQISVISKEISSYSRV